MKRELFLEIIKNHNYDLGVWQIETEHLTDAEYVMGCVFVEKK